MKMKDEHKPKPSNNQSPDDDDHAAADESERPKNIRCDECGFADGWSSSFRLHRANQIRADGSVEAIVISVEDSRRFLSAAAHGIIWDVRKTSEHRSFAFSLAISIPTVIQSYYDRMVIFTN
jgi:hypothetical protein